LAAEVHILSDSARWEGDCESKRASELVVCSPLLVDSMCGMWNVEWNIPWRFPPFLSDLFVGLLTTRHQSRQACK
jgi:hypothetical protein